jgi:enoyl-CoA hydratase/carnithine racemase
MSPYLGSSNPTREWKHFEFSVDAGVATLAFARPEVLNALTFEVYADLRDLLSELPQRDDVGVLVVTGRGRGFCSGGDVNAIIGQLQEMDAHGRLEFTRMTGEVVRGMRACPLPIIAAVNGVAAGAGAVIGLAADLRVLARSAAFSFLFTKVGLAGADMGSAYLLPRLVGLSRATELLLLGEALDSQRVLDLGLAYRVVEDEDLPAAAEELARTLAEGPALAYQTTKLLLSRELDMDLAGSLELEAVTQALLMSSRDHAEFYDAFTSRRPPRWTGR